MVLVYSLGFYCLGLKFIGLAVKVYSLGFRVYGALSVPKYAQKFVFRGLGAWHVPWHTYRRS